MKKALTVTGLLLLTGCTVERTIVVEPTTTHTPTTQVASYDSETVFLDFIREQFGDITGLEIEILKAGWRTCENADYGWTAQDFSDDIASVASNDESMRLLAAVVAGALNFLCPQHRYLLDGLGA